MKASDGVGEGSYECRMLMRGTPAARPLTPPLARPVLLCWSASVAVLELKLSDVMFVGQTRRQDQDVAGLLPDGTACLVVRDQSDRRRASSQQNLQSCGHWCVRHHCTCPRTWYFLFVSHSFPEFEPGRHCAVGGVSQAEVSATKKKIAQSQAASKALDKLEVDIPTIVQEVL